MTTPRIALIHTMPIGQFSMARAATGIPAKPGRKVLTSPQTAVTRLKQMFGA